MAQTRDETNWFCAAKCGDLDTLKKNIMRTHVNRQDGRTGETALMLAAFNGHDECMLWLIKEEGADLNIRDKTDETALVKAARIGIKKCVELLLKNGADLNLAGFRHLSPLMNAVCNGHMECVKLLIHYRAILDIVDDLGSTALIKAAFAGYAECVKALLEKGALVNITDNNGQTALMQSAANGDQQCVDMLLDYGAHVDVKDQTSSTALIKVTSTWSPDRIPNEKSLTNAFRCIRSLCIKCANPNVVDSNNESVLMKAAAIGFTVCVDHLIELKAEVDIFNSSGQTALMIAAKHGHAEIVLSLCKVMDKSLQNVADLGGDTALMHAASNGKHECVTILAESGVEVDVVDNEGTTPLMHMARAGVEPAVRALLDAEADKGRRDKHRKTAWDMTGNEVTFRHLLETQ